MRATSATRKTDPDEARASKVRKDRSLQAFKEQGLIQFSGFLSKQRLAQLDDFVAHARGTVGPHGRRVNSRGDALELILARYFSDNPQPGSAPP